MLPVVPADKANHFVYGAVVACVVCSVSLLWWGQAASAVAGLVSAAMAGLLKEYRDYTDRDDGSYPEVADLLWTVLGGAVTVAPTLLSFSIV